MSNSVRPHRWQPTWLPCPWDSPGKNTGVGCHFLLQCVKVKSESEVTQSCPTPATPWTAAYQAPPSMGFSSQKYWSGVPLPSPTLIITIMQNSRWPIVYFTFSSLASVKVSWIYKFPEYSINIFISYKNICFISILFLPSLLLKVSPSSLSRRFITP